MKIDINLKNIFAISKKEFKNYFDSPTAYIVITVFLLLWEFLFFRNAFLVGEASLRILMNFLPWLFLLFIPAITMGSISQEKSEGTLEFLLTHPIKDIELIFGKFIAALGFSALSLLFMFPVAISFSQFGNLDWGIVAGQYLGSLFLTSVLISLGIFVSSRFSSQIASLLVAAAISFFLTIAGFEIVTASLPPFISSFFERLSVLSHFESMTRGVIDLRDLWYFLSVIVIFLSLAYLELLKRRFGNRRSLYRSYQLGIALFIGIAVLTNIIGARIPGRIDLTQDGLYTLTATTKKTLSELKDVVNITLFASDELPAQLQPVLRDTKDILRDYQTFGKGTIVVSYKNPSGDQKAAQEAESLGVRQVQFNVIGQEEFQLKRGYLGLAVSYASKNESIPFIQDTSDIEYQLTSFIKKLTTKDKKKIVFLSGHGEKNLLNDYRLLSQELEKQFETQEITVDKEKKSIPENTAALVIAGPTQKINPDTRSAIKQYLDTGGSALFLIDSVNISPQVLSAFSNQQNFSDFLKEYGIEVRPDLAYDLRSNETVRFGGGFISYALPYPFWVRAIATEDSPIVSRIESIILPWASTIALDDQKLKSAGFVGSKLFTTTKFGNRQQGNFSIAPDAQLSRENLGEQVVAVSAIKEGVAKQTRLVVVGDSDFLTDQFVQQSPENIAFGMAAISWIGQEESLAGLRVKQKSERKLLFENPTQITLVKYGNMALALFLPAAFGAFRLMRRRNLRRLTYSNTYE